MNHLKDFFYYTRTERNAVLSLLVLLLVVLILPYTFSVWRGASQQINFDQWKADVDAFEEGMIRKSPMAYRQKNASKKKWTNDAVRGEISPKEEALQPEIFDPNTATARDFEAMGLPENTIRGILNYRGKGGQFKTKEALQKIYTLSDKHYQQLLPFIRISKEYHPTTKSTAKQEAPKPLPPAFDFDPNKVSAEELELLGLSTRTIRSILNYRTKGGQFRSKEDFKKIYTLPDSVYQHLYAHIKIVQKPKRKMPHLYKTASYTVLEVNTASVKDFQQFRGIGPSYAKRIVKMRESLGGFANLQQIADVYHLPDSTYQLMLPYLTCKKEGIQQININTATIEELRAHPYLSWGQAKAIVYYRETEGNWKTVDLIQILTELDDGKQTFQKIKPYLKVD